MSKTAEKPASKKTRSDNPDRIIALIEGDSGTGKSFFVGSLKDATIYDTEIGGGLTYLDARIEKNGSERKELFRYPDILADLRASAQNNTLKKNLVIDNLTVLQQESILRHNPALESDYGRSGAKATSEWRQIREFVRTFDCNLWIVTHLKNEFEKDKAIGKIADGAKNIEGDMHIVLRLVKQGGGKVYPSVAEVVKWRRDPEDPRGTVPAQFPFTLSDFEKINGVAYMNERAKVELAKPESVKMITDMLEFVGEDRKKELTQKWFTHAGVDTFDQMTETQVQGCIEFVRKSMGGAK